MQFCNEIQDTSQKEIQDFDENKTLFQNDSFFNLKTAQPQQILVILAPNKCSPLGSETVTKLDFWERRSLVKFGQLKTRLLEKKKFSEV